MTEADKPIIEITVTMNSVLITYDDVNIVDLDLLDDGLSNNTGDRGLNHTSEKANNSHCKQSGFCCALSMSIC